MASRILIALCCASALILACGPHHSNSETTSTAATFRQSGPGPNGVLTAALDVSAERGVDLVLRVVNRGTHRLEISFPDARTHDFVVLDSIGREVWHWSAGRMFTQAMQNRMLSATDTLSFREHWTPPASGGTFTAIALFPSSNHPLEQRTQFIVRPLNNTTAARD